MYLFTGGPVGEAATTTQTLMTDSDMVLPFPMVATTIDTDSAHGMERSPAMVEPIHSMNVGCRYTSS